MPAAAHEAFRGPGVGYGGGGIQFLRRQHCLAAADVVYTGVRAGGRGAFYGTD